MVAPRDPLIPGPVKGSVPGGRWGRRAAGLLAPAALAVGCTVTPLTNKLEPGEDPIVIGVGEGRDGQTDLFAAAASGGPFFRLTFSRPIEAMPALSPAGTAVAFLRARSPADTTHWELVVLNLLTAGERSAPLPDGIGRPAALGWSRNGDRLYVSGGTALATAAPPARLALTPVTAAGAAEADSAMRVLLGEPPFAAIAACGGGPCAVSRGGDTTRFDPDVRAAFRWGADSVGLVRDGAIEVRPLGGGRSRRPAWSARPERLRDLTYHPGAGQPPAAPPR